MLFEVLVTDSQDHHDRAATIGLGDRVHSRIKPRGGQRLDTGDRQFLKLGVRQINDFRHEVVALDLIEVFVGQFDRDAVVAEVRIGRRVRRIDLQGRIQRQPLAAGDRGQL